MRLHVNCACAIGTSLNLDTGLLAVDLARKHFGYSVTSDSSLLSFEH